MSGPEFQQSLDAFRNFIETEPVISILSRNLYYLLDKNKLIDAVEIDDSLQCVCKGRVITLSIKPYLIGTDFGKAHWLAALRVFLAHEVQHINSSDREVQRRVKGKFAQMMKETHGVSAQMSAMFAEQLLDILENGRVNNIVCARFPGYIPMMRFVCFAKCTSPRRAASECASAALGDLYALLDAIETRALTGIGTAELAPEILWLTDEAVLSKTAAGCGETCMELLMLCQELIAAACEGLSDITQIAPNEYAYSAGDRPEQTGDGTDSRMGTAESDLPVDSIDQVLGAGKSVGGVTALTESETAEMLQGCVRELEKEKAYLKANRIQSAERTVLSKGDMGTLKSRYPNVVVTENGITPSSGALTDARRAKALHNRLERVLREQRQRREGERTGAVSRKNLWRVAIDDPDVFSRKTAPREYESSFCLLIDKSGSMGTGYAGGASKLVTALKTAAILEEALKGIAYTKIVAFDGSTDSVAHTIIKDYGQKELGNRCMDALKVLTPGNGNKDGYSIRTVSLELAKRREKRKILVVLSDGLPSGYRGEAEAIGDVRTAVQEARRSGIIVIPILYGAENPEKHVVVYRQMYERGIVCASPDSVLSDFEKLLISLIR